MSGIAAQRMRVGLAFEPQGPAKTAGHVLGVLVFLALVCHSGVEADEGATESAGPAAEAERSDASPAVGPARRSLHHIRGEASLLALAVLPTAEDRGAGFGYGVAMGAGWSVIPVTLGIDVLLSYGNVDESEFDLARELGGQRVNYRRQDSVVSLNAWLRAQPAYFRVRPYAEGFVGTGWWRSRETISFVYGEGSSTRRHRRSRMRDFGWGAGIELNPFPQNRLAFFLSFRRLYGSDLTFQGQVPSDQAAAVSVTKRVPVGCNLIALGLSGHFDFAGAEPVHPRPLEDRP